MPKQTNRGSGGTKKYTRSQNKCARYRAEGRKEKNKARKLAKYKAILEKQKARRERREEKGG